MEFNRILIDSSKSKTDLCELGIKHPTDKSPYVVDHHFRHPYTAVYDMLFMGMRYKPIKFAEGGILLNNSMKCWREYFPYAELHGFDVDQDILNNARSHNLENTTYHYMDVNDSKSIADCFEATGGDFDIIIDDMIHELPQNSLFASHACRHLKPGGILVIEDIFRITHEIEIYKSFESLIPYFSSITSIVTEHNNRYSPGWNNDKLLVFSRNEKQIETK